ncbi:gamma-glutamylcyclotransferase family protein [Salaquimonas pukyongi]|uniref:gamma-glutamylcyclotransferase family protein n=1 Tax=Salaquimonas pukyongi TaxID=2712698 RepID=UPI00096BC877|nr:gamma-glutamylcyclotransferase family protein [Salaquimonas pukyongi]
MNKGSDRLIAYFGYGSLVNLATLATPYRHAVPARLKGWRRHWQSRPGDGWPERALLSVHRDNACEIHGMLVFDGASSLPSLDERERHYDRVPLTPQDISLACNKAPEMLQSLGHADFFVYVGRAQQAGKPPLLQSYLHTVMDGFLASHGEEGLSAFMRTTAGFDREILEDLHAPHYPRMTPMAEARRRRFDRMLREAGVRFAGDPAADAE